MTNPKPDVYEDRAAPEARPTTSSTGPHEPDPQTISPRNPAPHPDPEVPRPSRFHVPG